MFPVYHSFESKRLPVITYCILLVMAVTFCFQLFASDFDEVAYVFGVFPEAFFSGEPSEYLFLITALFLHGGFFHLLVNMWFFYIMGSVLEKRFGHLYVLLLFFISGVAANYILVHVLMRNTIPFISASGAIAGVAVAYTLVFVRTQVKVLGITRKLSLSMFQLPWLVLPLYWLVLQLFASLGRVEVLDYHRNGAIWYAIGFGSGIGAIFGTITLLMKRLVAYIMAE